MAKFPNPVPPERQPQGMAADIVLKAQPDDERVWVPMGNSTWFRPLLLHTVEGYWTFGEGVSVQGDVTLGVEGGAVPDGTVLGSPEPGA